jgi:hypothetical protein
VFHQIVVTGFKRHITLEFGVVRPENAPHRAFTKV